MGRDHNTRAESAEVVEDLWDERLEHGAVEVEATYDGGQGPGRSSAWRRTCNGPCGAESGWRARPLESSPRAGDRGLPQPSPVRVRLDRSDHRAKAALSTSLQTAG